MPDLHHIETALQMGDADLFSLARKGNEAAFTMIYNRYHKQLYILAYTYLKDRDLAEDAIQHIFTKLWEFREDTIIKVNLRNFLYTITKNHILNLIRSENSIIQNNYKIAQNTDVYEDNLVHKIEEKELMALLGEALKKLPEQKKQVCLLKINEKLSNQEIAETMQISINTVKTHYAQAIKLLRAELSKIMIIIINFIILR